MTFTIKFSTKIAILKKKNTQHTRRPCLSPVGVRRAKIRNERAACPQPRRSKRTRRFFYFYIFYFYFLQKYIFDLKIYRNISRTPRCRAAGGSGAAGVYSCKFPNRKYIFVKNKNIKYKNKKTAFRLLV